MQPCVTKAAGRGTQVGVYIVRKLGLVGGIGPESTLDYYKGIIAGFRARTGGAGYPLMVIDSLDLDVMYNLADKKL